MNRQLAAQEGVALGMEAPVGAARVVIDLLDDGFARLGDVAIHVLFVGRRNFQVGGERDGDAEIQLSHDIVSFRSGRWGRLANRERRSAATAFHSPLRVRCRAVT